MNASIHKYSLSISCSLVVAFSSSLKKKKAIKAGQKQARTQVVHLEYKERATGRGVESGIFSSHSLFAHSHVAETSSETHVSG